VCSAKDTISRGRTEAFFFRYANSESVVVASNLLGETPLGGPIPSTVTLLADLAKTIEGGESLLCDSH